VIGGTAAHGDLAAGRRELDRVRQEIERDLLERAAVGAQLQIGSDAGAERDVLLLRARRDDAHGFGEQGVERQVLEVEPHAAGFDLGHVEDVVPQNPG
jgi:serine/threonine protein kinase HipA of HipAB toxin-antitoxin module